jgi:hypothetical protein
MELCRPGPGLGARKDYQDIFLGNSLSLATELLGVRIDATTTNEVRWVPDRRSLSYFVELGTELELLGSGHSADPTKDQVDTL